MKIRSDIRRIYTADSSEALRHSETRPSFEPD